MTSLKDELGRFKLQPQNKVLGDSDIENKVDQALVALEEWLSEKKNASSATLFKGMIN